jgi:arylsulfatase
VVPAGRTETGLLAAPDLLPTLAALAGATLPDDRALDGGDAGDLLRGTGPSPREEFLYYNGGHLDAVRDSRWKLFVGHTHFNHHAGPVCELHDLINDPGETTDLAARQPETVRSMLARIEAARERLGDEAVGADGRDRRPIGRVADPRPLTVFDADRPYLIPLYDLDQMG